jgi:hypothetical protein
MMDMLTVSQIGIKDLGVQQFKLELVPFSISTTYSTKQLSIPLSTTSYKLTYHQPGFFDAWKIHEFR